MPSQGCIPSYIHRRCRAANSNFGVSVSIHIPYFSMREFDRRFLTQILSSVTEYTEARERRFHLRSAEHDSRQDDPPI